MREMELSGDYTSRLAYLEEIKTFPFADVWERYCETQSVPVRDEWLPLVKKYEKDILSAR